MPKDFGVIGFANETFGEPISPSLSSVDQQTVEIGKTAAGLLIKMINSSNTFPVILYTGYYFGAFIKNKIIHRN